LFSRARIRSYSSVVDSVILPDVDVGQNCRIHRAIIDRGSRIEAGTIIGEDHDADRKRGFRVTDSGLTLVTPDMLGQSLHSTR
jgi:glucose-1-phosphate adenylyltransferase